MNLFNNLDSEIYYNYGKSIGVEISISRNKCLVVSLKNRGM